jgi:hypothetical protein
MSAGGGHIYGPMCQIYTPAPHPGIFVGDVSPMNVTPYIHRCDVTDEYIVNSSVLTNTLGYVHWSYVHRCIHRLSDEFIVYSLV